MGIFIQNLPKFEFKIYIHLQFIVFKTNSHLAVILLSVNSYFTVI